MWIYPQYADLEKVYEEYKDKLVVVGFLPIILEDRNREPIMKSEPSARKTTE
jgi:glutathione peroxidase-family protein